MSLTVISATCIIRWRVRSRPIIGGSAWVVTIRYAVKIIRVRDRRRRRGSGSPRTARGSRCAVPGGGSRRIAQVLQTGIAHQPMTELISHPACHDPCRSWANTAAVRLPS